jgi:hypothetical protein
MQPMMQEAGKLQLVEAEHRQRQQHEDQGKGAEDPDVLQSGRQQHSREGRRDPRRGVGERHAQDVGDRKQERAPLADLASPAGDDAGQDRDHRQHAGRKREQQAEQEEAAEDEREVALEQALDVEIARKDRKPRHGIDPGRRLAHARALLDPRGGELKRCARFHRHVAHAGVGASLRHHLEVEAALALDREADPHALAVHLRLAEEVVLMRKASRKLGRPQLHRRVTLGGELEALAVQVVAVGDGEGHLDARGVDGRAPRSGTLSRAREDCPRRRPA